MSHVNKEGVNWYSNTCNTKAPDSQLTSTISVSSSRGERS